MQRSKSVWITLTDMKLYRLRKPKFLNWGEPEGLRNERPIAVVQNGDAIWIEQEGGLWCVTDGKLKPVSLGSKRLQFMEKDDAGRIWALTDDQAFIIDSVTGPATRKDDPASRNGLTLKKDERYLASTGSSQVTTGAGDMLFSVPFGSTNALVNSNS